MNKLIIMIGMVAATVMNVSAETFEFVTHKKDGTNTVTVINTVELNRVGMVAATANEKTIDIMVQRHSLGLGARMFMGGKALDRIIARRNRLNLPSLEEITKVENSDLKQALLTQWVTLTQEKEIQKAEETLKQKKSAAEKAKKAAKAKVETETKK
jgi:hypothetical protein